MAHQLPPEFRLSAACAIWPPSNRRIEAIRASATGRVDWQRLLRVAKRHGVIGLVNDGLTRAPLDVPPAIASEIGAQAAKLVRENLVIAAEALQLQRLFETADVPVLFVKGTALAVLAFGNIGLRGAQDIDLLVPWPRLAEAVAVLAKAGYRRFDPPPNVDDVRLSSLIRFRKDFGFVHEESKLTIELHWRLFLNPHAMTETSIFQSSQVVQVAGSGGLRTMGQQELFAYLCLHGALHWWNRLKWLADVNALIATAPEDVDGLFAAAEARGVGSATSQALLLCHRLFGTSLPSPLMATLAKSTKLRWLESTALSAMTAGQGERNPHEGSFGTTRGSLSTFLLNSSWRYWLAELNIHLINQTDVLNLPLPRRLSFLYPLLRLPLWAWRHVVKGSAEH